MTPAARREAVAHLKGAHEVSERRACAVLGVDRSNVRYRSRRSDDSEIRARVRELAARPRRFGYRRLHLLLAREGCHMNQKRFRRIYREERLQVRRRGGRKRALGTRAPLNVPSSPTRAGRWTLSPIALPMGAAFAYSPSSTTARANAWRSNQTPRCRADVSPRT